MGPPDSNIYTSSNRSIFPLYVEEWLPPRLLLLLKRPENSSLDVDSMIFSYVKIITSGSICSCHLCLDTLIKSPSNMILRILKKTSGISVIIVSLSIHACGVVDPPETPKRLLMLSAPEELVIGDQHLRIKGSLWYDRMPGSMNEHGLMIVATLTEMNQKPIQSHIVITGFWAIHDTSTWDIPLTENQSASSPQSEIRYRGEQGPGWSAGDCADVIFEFRTDADRMPLKLHYLRARDVNITIAW